LAPTSGAASVNRARNSVTNARNLTKILNKQQQSVLINR